MIPILLPSLVAMGFLLQGCSQDKKSNKSAEGNDETSPSLPASPGPSSYVPPDRQISQRPTGSASKSEAPCPAGKILKMVSPKFRLGTPTRKDVDALREALNTQEGIEHPKARALIHSLFYVPRFEIDNLRFIANQMNSIPNKEKSFMIIAYAREQSFAAYRAQAYELLLQSMGVEPTRLDRMALSTDCIGISSGNQRLDILLKD